MHKAPEGFPDCFVESNDMKIIKDKTTVMLFNRSKTMDFQPIVQMDNQVLNVVEETKLLGVMISSDLKWKKHIQFVKKKFSKKLWALNRMRDIGATDEEMLEVYKLQIRCLTEIGCAAWNGSLTVKDRDELERTQKLLLELS